MADAVQETQQVVIASAADVAAGVSAVVADAADEKTDKDGFCWWVRSMPKPKPTGSTKGDAHAAARRVNFMKLS